MSKAIIRVGIVGAGPIGGLGGRPNSHAGAYRRCEDAELVAIADINPVRLQQFGDQWAIAPEHQRRGHATECGRALIDCAFSAEGLGVHRIIATTAVDNLASQAVMRKLGMRLERNDTGSPPWQQVTAVLTPEMFRAP